MDINLTFFLQEYSLSLRNCFPDFLRGTWKNLNIPVAMTFGTKENSKISQIAISHIFFYLPCTYILLHVLSQVAFISSQIFVIAGEERASANIEIYSNQVKS